MATLVNNQALNSALGSDIIDLLLDDDITEIYCNMDGFLWISTLSKGKIKTNIYYSPEDILLLQRKIAGLAGDIINEESPELGCEIKGYGHRFQGIIPPLSPAPVFNIRKKATKIFSINDYVASKSISEKHKEYLISSIKARKNILVVGSTGSGKTTFLNALLALVSELNPSHRIVILEDLRELQCSSSDYLTMQTRADLDPAKRVTMTDLLRITMRVSPTRIVVGEVRDASAYAMLKAWNTGHPGGLCTTHADGAIEGLDRLEVLIREDGSAGGDFKGLIGQAVNVVVSIQLVEEEGEYNRKITEIIEIKKYNQETKQYEYIVIPSE